MRCPTCAFDVPEEMRFCGRCGRPMRNICPRCRHESPPERAACEACGAALPAVSSPRPAPGRRPEEHGRLAERRQLTVMFCDLADAAILSEQLDPEEYREIIRDYQSVAQKVVERHRGHVAQYLGDGLMVYFGYPQAYGDDPRRAVAAGLGMVEAVTVLSNRLELERGIRLAVRVGIHTGPVVTGDVGTARRHETLALGQTPNVAAILQGLAKPGEVVLSVSTYEVSGGFFAAEPLGERHLKGLSEPIKVFRVVKESDVHSRFELAVRRGLTPLAGGRRRELDRLRSGFSRAQQGEGQAVLITGESGIGKSRLVHALKEELAAQPPSWWKLSFSADLHHSPYAPLVEFLGSFFGLASCGSAAQKLTKLGEGLAAFGLSSPQAVPLVAGFLSIPADERYPSPELNPGKRSEETLELLLDVFRRLSAERPAVVVAEDIHWSDPSTLHFLELLVREGSKMRLLAVLTCSSSFVPPWPPPLHQTEIALERLDDEDAATMVRHLCGGKALPRKVLRQILDKAEGIPLFVEELTRAILESDLLREEDKRWVAIGAQPSLAIPSTLQDLLMAHLDRRQDAKGVAQLAAVLGRQFRFEHLLALSSADEAALRRGLDRLVEAGIIAPSGEPSAYAFRSALIREAAYKSLLKSQRQRYHRQVARHLLDVPGNAADRPEIVAHHLTEAGLGEEALDYWLQAGRRALASSANPEAIAHLNEGLELLATLTPSKARDEREIAFQSTLGVAWATTRGFGAQEAERAHTRAYELCTGLDEPPQLAGVMNGLWMARFARAEFDRALELGSRMLELAETRADADALLMAHFSLGATLFYQGHFGRASEHLETGLALETAAGDPGEGLIFVADHRVSVLCLSALTLWVRGYPEKAAERIREALARARQLSHPFSLVYALGLSAWLHTFRREEDAVGQRAGEMLALADQQGFYLAEWDDFFLGPILGHQGSRVKARTWSQSTPSGQAATTGLGLNLGRTAICCFLAEKYCAEGHLDKAEGALRWGFDALRSTEERYWEGELYRLSGELALATGGEDARREAESCFQEALAITTRQGARSLRLRAAVGLGRLWQSLGKNREARDLVAGVLETFTEGFDTTDLKAARELLEALS
ncbi:MAG: AAA family ATPase [bacterium]|nr:AAA family ATPase [bacterium]